MGSRREGRELCLQALYLHDNCGLSPQDSWDTASKNGGANEEKTLSTAIIKFARALYLGTIEYQESLNDIIQKQCLNWQIERMAVLDRNILRMATYEIIHTPDTPIKVIINEAVEIAKNFSTEESGKFVNGILDKLKTRRSEKKD
ncbi:transcription antitermination factor NusB [Elusimicrobiota bacterium]